MLGYVCKIICKLLTYKNGKISQETKNCIEWEKQTDRQMQSMECLEPWFYVLHGQAWWTPASYMFQRIEGTKGHVKEQREVILWVLNTWTGVQARKAILFVVKLKGQHA